jgi:hypothetical protein
MPGRGHRVVELDVLGDIDPKWTTTPVALQKPAGGMEIASAKLHEIVGDQLSVIFGRGRYQSGQPLWMHRVVAVHNRDPLAAGNGDGAIPRGGWTAVAITPKQPNALVRGPQLRHDVNAVICRSVVGNDKFKIT